MKNKLRCADLYGQIEQATDSSEGSNTYLVGRMNVGDSERQRVVARKMPCERGREIQFAEVRNAFHDDRIY